MDAKPTQANYTVYRKGDLVRIVPAWCDRIEERDERFIVVEDNGDRCVIELVCEMPIRPQEVVSKHAIERLLKPWNGSSTDGRRQS